VGEALKRPRRSFRKTNSDDRENVVEGFENAPDAFLGLFEGENIGKQLVKVGAGARRLNGSCRGSVLRD